MAKKPVSPTLADVVNSPEYKGMSESVKRQIENALLESKGKPPLPKTNKTSLSTEEVLANPAIVKAIKEKIGEEAAEDFIKKADEKTKIDDTDKLIVVDKQNKVRKTKQKTRKQQEIEQQENTQRSLKDIVLGKGSRAFNKMFPMLGALMGGVYRGGDRSANNNTTTQTNTSSNASGTTAILSSIIDSQKTSVDILQQILAAIKATPRTPPPPASNQNQTPQSTPPRQTPPASNQNQRSSTTPPVTGPRAQMNLSTAAATVAGGAAIAGAGYAAQRVATGGGRNTEGIIGTYAEEAAAGATRPYINPEYSEEAAAGATRPYINPETPIYDRGEPARERTISDLLKEHRENVEFNRRVNVQRQINSGAAHYTAASNLENYSPEPTPSPAATPAPAATPIPLISPNVGNWDPEPTPYQRTIPNIQDAEKARIQLAGSTAADLLSRDQPPARRINSDTERAFDALPRQNRSTANSRTQATLGWQPPQQGVGHGAAGQVFSGEENPLKENFASSLYSEDAAMATRNSRYFAIMEEQRIENLREYFNGLDDKFNGKDTSDGSGDGREEGGAGGDATPKSASQEAQEEDLRENRILNFKADEIFFKADKFEFEGGEQDQQDASKTTSNNVGGGGGGGADATPAPNTASTGGGTGGGSSSSAAGGNTGSTTGAGAGTDATPAPTGASGDTGGEGVNGATGGNASQAGTPPPVTGLNFAPGVDQRIKPGIADKVKDVQSGFGKGLSITSGYRDPARNRNARGAANSVHMSGNAVDVTFPGNQEDTINFIKTASAKGLGGIGVYRPGFVHIDTGPKRIWGPDYHAGSIPAWAKAALNDHMTGQTTATPAGSSPTSGAAVAEASAQNDMSIRSPSSGPSVQPSNSGSTSPVARSESSSNPIDPNDPGPLEPADAGVRYARLFSMAA